MSAALAAVLAQREREYDAAIDRLRDVAPNDAVLADVRTLREAVKLVRCLRFWLASASVDEIHKLFGAPGDFGYDTAIGDALFRTYRGAIA